MKLKWTWGPVVSNFKNSLVLLLLLLAPLARAADGTEQKELWLWPEQFQRMLDYAGLYEDTPYQFGARRANTVDCSSLIQKVFSMIGIELPRSSREQARDERFEVVDKSELRAGDLVFFTNTWRRGVSHVALMLDGTTMIHGSPRHKKVHKAALTPKHPLWRKIHSVRRWRHSVIDEELVKPRFSWDDKV